MHFYYYMRLWSKVKSQKECQLQCCNNKYNFYLFIQHSFRIFEINGKLLLLEIIIENLFWCLTEQKGIIGKFACPNGCGKVYRWYRSLHRHFHIECGKDPQLLCPLCPYRTKHKNDLNRHMGIRHKTTCVQNILSM